MKNGNPVGRWLFWIAFAVIAGLILLVMIQVDRQWQRMGEMTRVMQEQAEDIRRTRGLLRDLEQSLRNAEFRTGTGRDMSAATTGADAFARARRAAANPDYASDDWLMLAFSTRLKTITPLVSSDAYAAEVQGYVLESLLVRDP